MQPIKMYRGIPNATATTLAYDVQDGKRIILKHVRVTNVTDNEVTFTMLIGSTPTADGTAAIYLASSIPVKARDVVIFELNEVLEDNEKVYVKQGTANALHVQISGVEVTL